MWNFEVNYYSKVGKFANFAAQRRFEKEVHEKVSKLGSLADAEVSSDPTYADFNTVGSNIHDSDGSGGYGASYEV